MGRSNKGYFVIAINYKLNKVGYVNSTKKYIKREETFAKIPNISSGTITLEI